MTDTAVVRGRWEYLLVKVNGADTNTADLLDDYGKGGWEAFAVGVQFTTHTIYLKRVHVASARARRPRSPGGVTMAEDAGKVTEFIARVKNYADEHREFFRKNPEALATPYAIATVCDMIAELGEHVRAITAGKDE